MHYNTLLWYQAAAGPQLPGGHKETAGTLTAMFYQDNHTGFHCNFINYMKYSTLYLKMGFVLDEFAQL